MTADQGACPAPPDHAGFVAHLEADAAAFVAVLRSTDLSTPVPGCPGWGLRELGRHLGTVHRWAAAVVRSGAQQPKDVELPEDGALAGWCENSADMLLAALREVPPDRVCWTLAGEGQAAYWSRRQALETALHRADAERAAGGNPGIPTDLAEDGIVEVLDSMLPGQVARGRTPAPTTGAALVTGTTRLLGVDPPTATVTGPADAVLLLLWGRTGRDDPRLTVTGNLEALDRLLALALTP